MRSDSVGLAKQVALGTKQTTMEFFVPVESADISFNRETLEVEETSGLRFPSGIDYGTGYWEVGLSGAARAASLPRMLSAFMGAPTTSTPDVGAAPSGRNHAFNPVTGSLVPHSILLNRTDPSAAITDLVFDSLGNQLTLSVAANGFLMFDAGFAGRDNDDARPEPSVTSDASTRWAFDQCHAYLTVDGGSEIEIPLASWSMQYNNNIDTSQVVLGQRTLYTIAEGNADASFSFAPRDKVSTATLASHYRRALAADPAKNKLRLVATGATIGGAVAYKVEVTGWNLEYLTAPANINAADRLSMIEVNARAAYDTASSKFVTVDVVNTTASY